MSPTPSTPQPSAEAMAAARNIWPVRRDVADSGNEFAQKCILGDTVVIDAEFAALRQRLERAEEALKDMATMPRYDQDDAHRLRHRAQIALAAMSATSAKPGEKEGA